MVSQTPQIRILLQYTFTHIRHMTTGSFVESSSFSGIMNGNITPSSESTITAAVDDCIRGVITPSIGLVGVIGNVLNLGILSWRSWRRDDDTMEKVALVGLIALAVSDLCFCLTILPHFASWRAFYYFDEPSFGLYFRAYGHYFNDIFIKISTWLTMIVATAR